MGAILKIRALNDGYVGYMGGLLNLFFRIPYY